MMKALPEAALSGPDFHLLDGNAIIRLLQEPNLNLDEFTLYISIYE